MLSLILVVFKEGGEPEDDMHVDTCMCTAMDMQQESLQLLQ